MMNYEIERKFLIELPDTDDLDIKNKTAIYQVYLRNDENNTQRRVRKTESDGVSVYTYTEKVFVTPVTREETEFAISEEKYLELLLQARKDCAPVEKVRYRFEYLGQMFEMDTYPFSDRFAILELELENAEQYINFPECINVIKEVSDDAAYSNAALATAGAFPEI